MRNRPGPGARRAVALNDAATIRAAIEQAVSARKRAQEEKEQAARREQLAAQRRDFLVRRLAEAEKSGAASCGRLASPSAAQSSGSSRRALGSLRPELAFRRAARA